MLFLVFLVLALNFGISWLNAWSVGRSWADSKAVGGWPRFMVWCAATMSASGFTWCYLIVIVLAVSTTGYLKPQYVQAALELGYVVIIIPVLGSGLAIWMDSVTTAIRRRNAVSIGVAGWNTFAMAHNTYEAARTLPEVLKHLGSLLKGGDAKGKALIVVGLLVMVALCAGLLTTAAIIRATARKYAERVGQELKSPGLPTKGYRRQAAQHA